MNAGFGRVRLYLGGITIIRLSSYVQGQEPFLREEFASEFLFQVMEVSDV